MCLGSEVLISNNTGDALCSRKVSVADTSVHWNCPIEVLDAVFLNRHSMQESVVCFFLLVLCVLWGFLKAHWLVHIFVIQSVLPVL